MANNKNKIVFVVGGARSGKSSFALKTASSVLGEKAYIATAQALDSEMDERIKKHRDQRGEDWTTFEEPLNLANAIEDISGRYSVIIVDCLTLWLSNIMHGALDVEAQIKGLKSKLACRKPSLVYLVSNEVGMGIVPDNEVARWFRDMAGYLNQRVAEIADEVYLVTAGIPLKIK